MDQVAPPCRSDRGFGLLEALIAMVIIMVALTALAQVMYFGFDIGEISCPTAYFAEASSINFSRSVTYGLGCLRTAWQLFAQRRGLASFPIFSAEGRRLVSADRAPLQVPAERAKASGERE